ncbi:MAG TPA: TusE/DsrC/DsvC family sulfur relay protein [Chromatiales bacterium]|nr:TusE/DsrC/DsvC family sulfur relay protein [Chromatiales bacterium]
MDLQVDGRSVTLDDEGYLIDPEDWNEATAHALAANENIELNEDHWEVFEFMRGYYTRNGITADARFVIKFLAQKRGKGANARSYLFTLFPYGYVKQACKLAGMRRPRAWSSG